MMIAHATIPLILYGLFPNHISLIALLLGSGAPNFDVLPTLLRKKTPKNALAEFHAASVLHTPLFYLILLPFVYFILNYFTVISSLTIAISFSLGGILHILMECFDEKGRRLLYPFSKKFYGIPVLPYDFWTYLTSKKTLAIEGLFFVIACTVLALRWVGLYAGF